MSYRLQSIRSEIITLKNASEYAEMQQSPFERLLSERRLQVYEKIARAGGFRPCVWSIAICLETGDTLRVNGQHTSVMYSRLAEELPENMATFEVYVCDTLEDVGRLYSTFDSKMQTRSASDINRAFAAMVPELAAVPKKIIDSAASGLALAKCGGRSDVASVYTAPERAEFLLDEFEFVVWAHRIIRDTCRFSYLARQGVLAAMFASWTRAKTHADKFWIAVRDETGERPVCPDRQLARWLSLTSVRPKKSGAPPKHKTADSREMFVRCLHCWNAWRRGEELKQLKYYADLKVPQVI